MLKFNKLTQVIILVGFILSFSACNKIFKNAGSQDRSHSTGWEYNNPEKGGFEVADIREQETGPGLVFIEGGAFVMGSTQENIFQDHDNPPRTVTVPSFYIDETEVSNLDYLEYLHWLKRIYGEDYPEVYYAALPDTLVWREQLAYNEPLVEMYLRHPSYHNYPVVGVSWEQATEYCKWRTDRVNEKLLIDAGAFAYDPNQKNENHFNTEAYLAGQYKAIAAPEKSSGLKLFNRRNRNQGEQPSFSVDAPSNTVTWEDGIMLPSYRLPTEAEWEYAALGLIGNTEDGQLVDRKTYPWDGNKTRRKDKKYQGSFVANFKKGDGDLMGIAGSLNDGADITAPVGSYWPNDYGLYNMGGNVSEWVQDVYRPLSFEDVSDYSPFRGNVFMEKVRNEDGTIAEKDSLGRIRYRKINEEEIKDRRNYRKADNINYRDGDLKSIVNSDWLTAGSDSTTKSMYKYGVNTLISDETRVYKGGSWKDPAFYLSPSVRRYLHQKEASNSIGFRCAMSRMGNTLPSKR